MEFFDAFSFLLHPRRWHVLAVMLEKHFLSAELSVPCLIWVFIPYDSSFSYLMPSSRNWGKGS